MKKLLLSSVAVCGLALAASPAHADLDLSLGGYTSMYGAFTDHDEVAGGNQSNDFDIVRDTELYVGGEASFDNGLTVGAMLEIAVDDTVDDNGDIDESYAYFSGSWGKVIVGAEDGASKLLQGTIPGADAGNIDGKEQFIQPVNFNVLTNGSTGFGAGVDIQMDYDNGLGGKNDKVTYVSPSFSGFQVGASYSPDSDGADDLEGVGLDNVENAAGTTVEVAAHYSGQFDQVGFHVGAGYANQELERNNVLAVGDATDDREEWNVQLDLDIGAFGIGVVYKEDNVGEQALTTTAGGAVEDDEEVFVIGADYTMGNYTFGASYYDADNFLGNNTLEAERYTAGVTYEYGPGMTLHGSIGQVELDNASTALDGTGLSSSVDATFVTIGTVVNF